MIRKLQAWNAKWSLHQLSCSSATIRTLRPSRVSSRTAVSINTITCRRPSISSSWSHHPRVSFITPTSGIPFHVRVCSQRSCFTFKFITVDSERKPPTKRDTVSRRAWMARSRRAVELDPGIDFRKWKVDPERCDADPGARPGDHVGAGALVRALEIHPSLDFVLRQHEVGREACQSQILRGLVAEVER